MTTERLTMAQALVKFLSQQIISFDDQESPMVEGIFAIFGHGNVTGLGEALEYQSCGLKLYQGHNEQGMAHAATAFAKQHNRLKIFACTSSVGPGAANMVTAAATATANRLPLLLLPGDTFASRQPDPVLQQIEQAHDYNLNVNDCFKPVSKYWDRINRPEQLMSALLHAFRVLTCPKETGAVTLCLPQDVQTESYDYPSSFFKRRVWHIDRPQASRRALSSAVDTIRQAKKPLIIAGGGIHYSDATQALKLFSEKHKIPVCETQAGKSALSWDHPFNMGGIGVTGSLSANILARDADLIIAIGTRLQDFTTASKSAFQHPNVKMIAVNINPMDSMKMDAMSLEGDAKICLQGISNQLADYQSPEQYQDTCHTLQEQWHAEVDRLYTKSYPHGLGQTEVLGILNETLTKEDVIICAAGSLPGDLHRLWRSKSVKDYHVEYAFSCMGYEVAAGLGVRLAKTTGEVYVVVGDGSFLMLHSELLTAIQEHQKINIILLDNSGYQCIKGLQTAHGSQGFGTEFRYRNPESTQLNGPKIPIDFAQYANALGTESFKAESLPEFRQQLQAMKKCKTTCLLEVKVLADSMSGGYESWWRVDLADVSKEKRVRQAQRKMKTKTKQAKAY